MKDTTSFEVAVGRDISNLPSISEKVPLVVPSTETEAPTITSPFSSRTVPVIVRCC